MGTRLTVNMESKSVRFNRHYHNSTIIPSGNQHTVLSTFKPTQTSQLSYYSHFAYFRPKHFTYSLKKKTVSKYQLIDIQYNNIEYPLPWQQVFLPPLSRLREGLWLQDVGLIPKCHFSKTNLLQDVTLTFPWCPNMKTTSVLNEQSYI